MSDENGSAMRSLDLLLPILAVAAALLAGAGAGDVLLALAALVACSRRGLAGACSPLLIVFLGLLAASHLTAADPWASWLGLAQWLRLGLAFWIGASLPGRGASGVIRLGLIVAVASALLAAHSAWQVFVLQPALLANPAGIDPDVLARLADGRAHSIFIVPGHLGAMVAAFAALLTTAAAGCALTGRRRTAGLLATGCVLALIALGLSRSLAGPLLLAGGLAVAALAALRARARLVLMAGGFGLAVLLAGGAAWSRASQIDAENPAVARSLNWTAAARLVRERPVLGWGGGAFAHEYARVRPPGANATRHAHQFALERAAEHGLLVLPLLAAFLAWFARAASGASGAVEADEERGERLLRAAPFAGAAALFAHGLVDFGWSEAGWAVPAALLVGLAAGPALANSRRPPRAVAISVVATLGLGLVLVGGLASWEDRQQEEALLAAARGQHATAAEIASRIRRVNPRSSRAWATEAEAVLAGAAGDPELAALAVVLADEAARRSPRRASLHALRARALLASGRRLEAWFAAERAALLAPTIPEFVQLRDALRPSAEPAP